MKRTFLLGTGLFLLICAIASAAPCPVATLNVYISTFTTQANGCMIDNKVFYNFSYTSTATGGATAAPSNTITVNPDSTALNPGFDFTEATWTLNANGQTMDNHLGFTVFDLGGALIDDSHLSILGSASPHFANASGPIVNVSEQNCGGALLPSCTGGQLVTFANTIDGTPSISTTAVFSPNVQLVDIFKDIALSTTGSSCAGTVNCSASISGLTETFSQVLVPETNSLILLLTVVGCALGGRACRRRLLLSR